MRPEIVDFLLAHDLPALLAPDYAWMTCLAGLATIAIVRSAARAEGEDPADEVRTLIAVYVSALLGGYVYEWIRHVPDAIAAGSLLPMARSGRAAWGGVIFGSLAAATHLRHVRRVPLGPFFDRFALAAGPTFFLVRLGCFLAGCDFGVPTSSPLGVRFPAESLAAIDHATRGWVPLDGESLPVHATQLYEGTLALAASLVAWQLRARRLRGGSTLRPGDAFFAWLALYAAARFGVEALRADDGRGAYAVGTLALSTAQWTSLTVVGVLGVAALVRAGRAARLAPIAVLVAAIAIPSAASAQVIIQPIPTTPTTSPPVIVPTTPPPATVSYTEPPPPPPEPRGPRGNVVTLRLAGALSFAMVAPQGSDGGGVDLDAAGQLHVSEALRFEIGGSLGLDLNRDLTAYRLHLRAALVPRAADFFEFPIAVEIGAAFLDVKSGFFANVGAFSLRFYGGPQFRIDDIVLITFEPIAFQIDVANEIGGVGAAWRPRILFGLVF